MDARSGCPGCDEGARSPGQPLRVQPIEVCARVAVVLVRRDIEDVRNGPVAQLATITTRPQIPEHLRGRLLGAVWTYQSEGALAYCPVERWSHKQCGIVVGVAPRVGAGG